MKQLTLLLYVIMNSSCSSSFIVATFGNKNVYKTKSNLTVQKVYYDHGPVADQRQFTIVPNNIPSVTKTESSTVIESTTPPAAPKQTTTTTTTTIPATTSKVVAVTTTYAGAMGNDTKISTSSTATFTVPAVTKLNNFIRYMVLSEEGDYTYIKILPGCKFNGITATDTDIVYNSVGHVVDKPSKYIFKTSSKDLIPNTHYLASSVLIGKIISLPGRIRSENWNNDKKYLDGVFSLGYGFGWKYKIGNNPYKSHYISTILYGAGISQQKSFMVAGKYVSTNKDSISAKTDEFALTYLSFGIAYEYEKFNIGIFAGKDKMFGDLKNWVYQDKWWWGIGIGYELFK